MALWTPSNLTGKVMWLDAADASTLTLNGSGVLNWVDKSETPLDAYQVNASIQPQIVNNALNGKPVVSVNGTQYFQFAQTRNLIDKTIIVVFDYTEGGGTNFMGDAPQRFQLWSKINFFATGYPLSNPTSAITMGTTWNIAQADHHATLNYYANGVLDSMTQTRSYSSSALFSYLFRAGSGNWSGRVAEFLMFDRVLTTDERQRVEGYLAHKWGITSVLVPGHPYYNTAPVTEIVVPVSIPNAPDGARYRISNQSRSNAEIENGVVSGGAGISTTFIADDASVPHEEGDTIHVDLTYPVSTTAYLPSRVIGEVAASGISGFIAQIDDEIYNFHGIDGSALTKFQTDFVQDDIEIAIAENFFGAEIYAFYVHTLTTESGIREWLGAITAIDNANFRINVPILPLLFDNQTETEVWQTDTVRIFRSDGARPVRHPTTGGGGIDMQWRSQVYTSVISTSDAVITGDISDVPAAVQTGMTAQGYTAVRATKIDNLDVAVSTRNSVAPDNVGVAAIKAKTDNLPIDPASETTAQSGVDAAKLAAALSA